MLLTFTDFLAFKEMFLAYRTVSLGAIFPFRRFRLSLFWSAFCNAALLLLVLFVQEKEGRGLDLSQGLLITPLVPAGSKQHGGSEGS